jgi:hypothetical protein
VKEWPKPGTRVSMRDGNTGVVQPYDHHPVRRWVPVAREDGVHLVYLLLELEPLVVVPGRVLAVAPRPRSGNAPAGRSDVSSTPREESTG